MQFGSSHLVENIQVEEKGFIEASPLKALLTHILNELLLLLFIITTVNKVFLGNSEEKPLNRSPVLSEDRSLFK